MPPAQRLTGMRSTDVTRTLIIIALPKFLVSSFQVGGVSKLDYFSVEPGKVRRRLVSIVYLVIATWPSFKSRLIPDDQTDMIADGREEPGVCPGKGPAGIVWSYDFKGKRHLCPTDSARGDYWFKKHRTSHCESVYDYL